MSFTAKSVIIDIADNWGSANLLGVRSVEFYRNGSLITLLPADFEAYATSTELLDYSPEYAFDTSLSKIGASDNGTEWHAAADNIANQRIICVFNDPKEIDEVRVNNSHYMGFYTNQGIRNTVLRLSSEIITDTTYNATVGNELIAQGVEINQHVGSNVEDEQSIPLEQAVDSPVLPYIAKTITLYKIAASLEPGEIVPTLYINRTSNYLNIFVTLRKLSKILTTNSITPIYFRSVINGLLKNAYLQDNSGLLLPLISVDITLSGTKGTTITAVPQIDDGKKWISVAVGPYRIITGGPDGVESYFIDSISWDIYRGGKRESLVIRSSQLRMHRDPSPRAVPAPISLQPNGSKTAATIPGAWDIMPGDDLSAGRAWRAVVDSANIHIKHGESKVVVYG